MDIRPDHLKIVQGILCEHLPVDVKVWVFGSRANWTTKDSSDLDIALEGENKLSHKLLGTLKDAFEDSTLPYTVDVVDLNAVSHEFKKIVEEQRVALPSVRASERVGGAWRDVVLGDVCTKIGSGATPRGGKHVYLEEGPYTLIRSQNVYNDGFHRDGLASIGERHADELKNVEVFQDDVLLNITGDSVARVCQVAPNVLPARVNQHVAIIRPDSVNLDAGYLRYCLVTPEMQTLLLSWAGSGGTRNALTKGMIESLEIPLPALSEQRAIAHILGTLDDKIELNRRMNETLEAMARALFKSWFVDFEPVRAKMEGRWHPGESLPGLPAEHYDLFPDRLVDSELGEIPEGWEVKGLGDITEKPQYGYTESAKDAPVGPKFLRITDINKKPWIEWETVPYCTIGKSDYDKYRLHEGDILIARIADPGHGCMIEEELDAVFASYLIRFCPQSPKYARYLQYWLRSDAYWGFVTGRGSGTTRVGLNAKVLGEFPVLVPSDPLLDVFGEQVGSLRARVVANVEEAHALATQRDALLPGLVSGDVVIAG